MEPVIEQCVQPPEHLQRALFSRTDELSMLPAVANEALELAKDPDCTSAQFASVVERDVNLATEILSMANSALFACGTPVVSLQQAIVRLGFRQCRNLILTSSAASLMKSLPLEQEWVREVLWQHSTLTAASCVHINRTLSLGFQGEEFTAGLLHDFGRLLLAVAAPEQFADADPLTFEEDENILEFERSFLETDHCAFGAWFAKTSGLPEALSSAIHYHHEPAVDHPHQKLIALVAAGDHVANHLQISDEPEEYESSGNRGIAQLAEITSSNIVEKFDGISDTLLEEILRDSRENSTTNSEGQ